MQYETLPTSSLAPFIRLNNISLNGVEIAHIGGEPIDAGVGIKHTPTTYDPSRPFLNIGAELVICAKTVEGHAKADVHLAETLTAAREFTLTPRGAIMVFLVVSMSTAAGLGIGQSGAWSGYVKFLPAVSIPTTWTETERKLLRGTSLEVAVAAKLQALEEEFENFREATKKINWCQKAWWDESKLTLRDWRIADSWFRSRALQFPSLGIGMAPILDFANHSVEANSYYSVDENSDVVLLPREAKGAALKDGEEITINYGQEKSAAEMVFSYGFLDAARDMALWLVLDLHGLPDDPLGFAKQAFFKSAPTLRIYDLGHTVEWTSHFIWLMCINEEDGLSFRVLQEITGEQHLQALWNSKEIEDIAKLVDLLEESSLWPIYQLRAATLVQDRVETQLAKLTESEEEKAWITDQESFNIGSQELHVATKLRLLERALLEKAIGVLETQKEKLLGLEVVQNYLMQAQGSSEFPDNPEALDDQDDLS
ncbi:SET domain-containing protein [Choiromyces venosus 120613-1]|uniref:SET domain-containing protein n=1 Tax=Choiromyces venosus 120613-1 TaxID=1336337 RepID=A0A3N4ITE2_9PEZI|nr:SET domain-containing protein [Choiromyces venosus 120613-1]